jgi:hypothetical protein
VPGDSAENEKRHELFDVHPNTPPLV